MYFDLLEKTLFDAEGSSLIPPCNIYNVDETGFSVCQNGSQKIIAKKGKKNVGILTSAEKGKNVTMVCCVSAAGTLHTTNVHISARPEFLDRGPVGAIGKGNKSGWITGDLFMEWFSHFLDHVQPSARPQPTLLLADGHASHTNNLQLIEKARERNVILLIFPSHCTHKLQPLDVAIFKSLKLHYDKEVSAWLHQHPGHAVQECDIAELVGLAYGHAATLRNATSAFAKTGIYPFNPNIFTDEDFAACDVRALQFRQSTC